jgi:hypothetical protein
MSRALVSLLVVTSSLALAQEGTPPTPPPAAEPTPPPVVPAPAPPPLTAAPATPAPVTPAAATDSGPKASDQAKKRFSRVSAGSGGPLFAFAEGLDGLILGGLAGVQMGSGGAFLGALMGGVLLGGGATLFQYFHPIGLASAGTISLGIGVGALAGFGIWAAAGFSSLLPMALTALGMSQLGMLVPLIALWDVDDIPGEDLALMGMTTVYAFALTALVALLIPAFSAGPGNWQVAAMLFAPAFGMGLGALWAYAVDLAPGRILKLTALPLGVGLLTFMLGTMLAAGNMQIIAGATLATTAATFVLTYFLTDDAPPAANTTASISMTPTVSMTPAGWRNEGMAVGPALVGHF